MFHTWPQPSNDHAGQENHEIRHDSGFSGGRLGPRGPDVPGDASLSINHGVKVRRKRQAGSSGLPMAAPLRRPIEHTSGTLMIPATTETQVPGREFERGEASQLSSRMTCGSSSGHSGLGETGRYSYPPGCGGTGPIDVQGERIWR